MEDLWYTGKLKPITFHLAPTDDCNLNCDFCSVKDRGGNELDFDQCRLIIDTYAKLGAKSVEITGGGDPLMYDDLVHIIEHAEKRGLAIGLITNGVGLNEWDLDFTEKLTWMRISLSGLDFGLKQSYYDIDPFKIKTYFGCSYVFDKTTSVAAIRDVYDTSHHLRAKYIRIVPNCYSVEDIEWVRENAPRLIDKYDNMFLQIKDYYTPQNCYWRYVKPFVNSDGWVYHCSTCSLFAGYFPEHWRVARIENAESIYERGLLSFDTSQCKLCFYSKQNDLLHDLILSKDVIHKEFI
jgi:organic radical activating enzyme